MLDLSNAGGSGNKGFLLPQVNLSSTIVWGLLGTIVTDGMVVYNKATAGSGANSVIPGLYFWAGGKWTILSSNPAASVNFPYCNSSVFSPAPSTGILMNGSAYTAAYSLSYTLGSGTAYNSISQTVNGLTLTRAAGTYAAGGGMVTYNLSGTYSGITNGTVPFSIVECGNTAYFGTTGDNVRGALSTSAAAYDAATTGTWVQVTGAEYNNAQSTVFSTAIIGASTVAMNTSNGANGWSAGYNVITSNNAMAANNYLYGYSIRTGSVSGSTVSTSLSIGQSATNQSGNYSNFPTGVSIPPINLVSNTIFYFVFKKQPTIFGNTVYLSTFNNYTQLLGTFSDGTTSYYSPISGTIPNATATASSSNAGNAQMQFLSTPTKQW